MLYTIAMEPYVPKESQSPDPNEAELLALERKLAERRQQLQGEGAPEVNEKELLREVLKKHIEELRSIQPAPTPQSPTTPLPQPPVAPLSAVPTNAPVDDARNETLRELVGIALTKSVSDAVARAAETSPYLLDELHDHLVDDYYDKLIQLKKIPKL